MNRLKPLIYYALKQLGQSLYDNLFYTTQEPVRGSIVYCDLAFGQAEHSGVYVGNKHIIHRNKKGIIEQVTIKEFLAGTTGISIYVSCDHHGQAVGSDAIACTAELMLGEHSYYSLLNNNCHRFCSACIHGHDVTSTFSLTQLKLEAKSSIQAHQWRVWDLKHRNKV